MRIKMKRRRRIALTGLVICVASGLLSAMTCIGSEARLVHVLTIFFSGFGGGASLVALVKKKSD